MRIISVRERTIPLGSPTANAAISFETMTASAVVLEVETGKGRLRGLGFSSVGRYGHGALMRERFVPRLLNAAPADFIDPATGAFAMWRFCAVLMNNEKDGGHGERSGAIGVLETAMWDAWAKAEDLPLWALLRREFGHVEDDVPPVGQTRVYASGGHYHADDTDDALLADEVRRALDHGYAWFKLKIGGASEHRDLKRIDAAVGAAGDPGQIAVDANCAYDAQPSCSLLRTIDRLGLRWIEEPVNPLNYRGLRELVAVSRSAVATGENLFSAADTENLLRYGGLRPGKDVLQMDLVLSYGFTEYLRMIEAATALGWSRRDFMPHAGHQVALHASAGLGLGGHETAVSDGPFGGLPDGMRLEDGRAALSDAPGAGIEAKPALYALFANDLD